MRNGFLGKGALGISGVGNLATKQLSPQPVSGQGNAWSLRTLDRPGRRFSAVARIALYRQAQPLLK